MGCASSQPVVSDVESASAVAPAKQVTAAAAPPPPQKSADVDKHAQIARIAAQANTGMLSPSAAAIEKKYKMGKLLGKGAFGAVHLATRKADNLDVGIKVISKMKFQGDEEYQYMLTEVQLHHRVRGHPNVTELYEYSEDKGNFYMVLECVRARGARGRTAHAERRAWRAAPYPCTLLPSPPLKACVGRRADGPHLEDEPLLRARRVALFQADGVGPAPLSRARRRAPRPQARELPHGGLEPRCADQDHGLWPRLAH